jgi:hypothetical protein
VNAFTANPFIYIFSLAILIAVVAYYAYGSLDQAGIASYEAEATVTGKQFTPGSTTYNTNVVGGNTLVQSTQQADFYAITLQLNGEPTVALVDKTMFEALDAGDHVRVSVRRTRFSGRLLVTDVRR